MERLGTIFANAMAQLNDTLTTALDNKRATILDRIDTIGKVKAELKADREELDELGLALETASDQLDDMVNDIDFLVEDIDQTLEPPIEELEEEDFDINDYVEDTEEED
jgi:ABC-type transporter Mla subunit MlaD